MKENFFAEKTRAALGGLLDFSHDKINVKSSLIEESLLAHGVDNRPHNNAGDRRQDQRASEGDGEAVLTAVEETQQAADQENDPGGLPPALPISHGRGVVAHGPESGDWRLTGKL